MSGVENKLSEDTLHGSSLRCLGIWGPLSPVDQHRMTIPAHGHLFPQSLEGPLAATLPLIIRQTNLTGKRREIGGVEEAET